MRRKNRNRQRAVHLTGRTGTPHAGVPTGEPDPLVVRYERRDLPLPDRAAIDAAVTEADDGRRLRPTGSCHDCGRRITGERRYCGPCLARRV